MTLLLVTLIVGLLLGLLGGGGSILMVPLLVYLGGMETKSAITTSLVVVGITSVVAMLGHLCGGRVCLRNGLAFGLSGMMGAYDGGRLAAYVPGNLLLLMFALVMLGTALTMLIERRDRSEAPASGPLCPTFLNLPAILFDGLLVGGITGLVGVGGGFVIVPALNILGGLPIRAAIGTSLLIIVMNSSAALAAYISHESLDIRLAGTLTLMAMFGSLLGSFLSKRISIRGLRRGFGFFVIVIAGLLIHRELSWQSLADVRDVVEQHQEFFRGLLTACAVFFLYWFRGMIHLRHQSRLDTMRSSSGKA